MIEIGRGQAPVNDAVIDSENAAAAPADETTAQEGASPTAAVADDPPASSPPLSRSDSLAKFVASHGLHLEAQQSTSASQAGATARANAAAQRVATTFAEVKELGKRIADSKGPASDADRAAWQDAQGRLREEVTAYATAVSALPPDAPERDAARAELANLSEQLATLELPVLARLDPAMGKSWDRFNSTQRDSEGASLPQRLKTYGLSKEDLQRYVLTGQEPAGLQRALADAQRRGEWPALGVVRAAYMMRADYLRATSTPDDTASRKAAANLDATAARLSSDRAAIHMEWGTRTAAKLLQEHPDPTTRSKRDQLQLDEAKRAIASVRAHAVEQVTQNPARFGKDSATRTLAADGLATEANIAQVEATSAMNREAKKLTDATDAQNKAAKPNDPKLVPPPPKMHADLAEGGVVDSKRAEAVKIDPRLGDVVHGGDRAVQFARDVSGTKKLRLANDEQQVAHLKSKQQSAEAKGAPSQRPPAELVAKVNREAEQLYSSTLATHDQLTREKPGMLSVEQTKLLAELGGDAYALSSKIAAVHHQKNDAEVAQSLAHEQKLTAQQAKDNVTKELGEFQEAKIARLQGELEKRVSFDPNATRELAKLHEDPVKYADAHADTEAEKPRHEALTAAQRNLDAVLPTLQKQEARAADELAYMQKVDQLDGTNTDAEMAAGLAKDALARAEPHMAAIPAKGPERLARMQAAIDNKTAIAGVATIVRDNADARIARTNERQLVLETYHQRVRPALGDDSVAKGAAFAAKVTADETEVKRAALSDAKAAASASESLRKQMGAELDNVRGKPAEAQAYKDALAAHQARMHGTVAELAADIDPKEANAQLDRAARVIADELPVTQVARLDTQQAQLQHGRNLARGEALATLGEAGIAVANRASRAGGIDNGSLVVEALGTAHRSALALKETLTIEGGGAAAATANKERNAGLRTRADGVLDAEHEIDRSVDMRKFADTLDKELGPDIEQYNKTYAAMAKDINSRDFGYTINLVSEALAGAGFYERGTNDEARYVGMMMLDQGARGTLDVRNLHGLADAIRKMRDAGVPDHVIMGALRDPRLAATATKEQHGQWLADMQKLAGTRFGATLPANLLGNASYVRTQTPLGRVLEAAPSNATGAIVAYVSHPSTALLAGAQTSLQDAYARTEGDWERFKPYAALGQVLDQVMLTAATSVTFAGVFARVAAATTIPQKFMAARAVAMGLSGPAKIAMLAGINAGEAGLGMLTGKIVSSVGVGIFGENTLGAKAFAVVGGGLQLGVGSAVAMRQGIAFQTALGLTMGSTPIVAEQLGASRDTAEQLGTAVGIFLPTVIGTITNASATPRASGVMVHEFGIDAAKANAVTGEAMRSASGTTEGGAAVPLRERVGQVVDARFKELGADARAKLADTLTLDAARGRVGIEPPAHGTPQTYVREIDAYYGRLEAEMVKQGVPQERARELVAAEKTAMYAEALATTNGLLAGAEKPNVPDAHSAAGAGATTRQTAEHLAQEIEPPQSLPSSGAGPQRSYRLQVADEIAQIGGIPRDVLHAQEMWPSLTSVEERLAFLRHAVNLRLQQYGIPEVGMVALQGAGNVSAGQYTVRQHEIAISEALLTKPALTREDVMRLTDSLRHEIEHVAQWTDMARVLAAQGRSAAEIVSLMGRGSSGGVSDRLANWAVAEQAAGRGIDLASSRAAVARQNYDSVYGRWANKQGDTRKQVMAEYRDAVAERDRVARDYARQIGTPNEAAAAGRMQAAQRRYDDALRAYRSLSEEHGAHVAGELAKREVSILGDRRPSGADDFERAPTRVYDRTPQPGDDAPTGRYRAAAPAGDVSDEAPTGQYRAPGASGQKGDNGGDPLAPSNKFDTNGSTGDMGPKTVNTGGGTIDTNSPEAQAARIQRDRPAPRLQPGPIAPVRIPRDDEVFRVNTVNGRVDMTAGEYRRRYQEARKWVSEQMTAHHWTGAGDGRNVSLDIPALQKRAAEMFGLDLHWQRVNNPIVNGKV